MAANLRDEGASSSWVLPRPRDQTRSRATLKLGNEGFLDLLNSPLSWRHAFEDFGDCRDVFGRIAAATAGDVNQTCLRKLSQITGHVLRPKIETCFRQRIR